MLYIWIHKCDENCNADDLCLLLIVGMSWAYHVSFSASTEILWNIMHMYHKDSGLSFVLRIWYFISRLICWYPILRREAGLLHIVLTSVASQPRVSMYLIVLQMTLAHMTRVLCNDHTWTTLDKYCSGYHQGKPFVSQTWQGSSPKHYPNTFVTIDSKVLFGSLTFITFGKSTER